MSGFATAQIAGVDLEEDGYDCKCVIVDGANLMPNHIGVNRFSASGAVFTQVLALSVGAKFGIRAEYIPKSVLDDVVAAINSAMSGAGSFNITATDEAQTINKTVVPDYEAGVVQYDGNQRADARAIKGVTFRFTVSS